ncbi:MAG: class I SAM-dependent methyltransferase [Roseiflexaceae bacterium]
MQLVQVREAYRAGGLAAVAGQAGADGQVWFYAALLAYAAQDRAGALRAAREAARRDPSSLVFRYAAAYLERAGGQTTAVYDSAAAFGAFIRGGGNVPLYAALSDTLRAIYRDYEQLRLLDIGVGDGLALLPALPAAPTTLDLVEPSAALLEHTVAALAARGVEPRVFAGTLQAFARVVRPRQPWHIAQATFSLQSIIPTERPALLRWLRARTERLLLAEFDPPAACADPLDPVCAAHVIARYEQGLAEYEQGGDLVAQGFLMPVMLGYVDPTAARTNYEQPIAGWQSDLLAAGFSQVRAIPLHDYWWASAYLLDAS